MNAHPALRTFTGIVCPLIINEFGFVSDMILACPGEQDVRIHLDDVGRELVRVARASMVRAVGVYEPSNRGSVLHVHRFEILSGSWSDNPCNSHPDQEVMEQS